VEQVSGKVGNNTCDVKLFSSTLEKHVKKVHGDAARANKFDQQLHVPQHSFGSGNPQQSLLPSAHHLAAVRALMKDPDAVQRHLGSNRGAATPGAALTCLTSPYAAASLFSVNTNNNNSAAKKDEQQASSSSVTSSASEAAVALARPKNSSHA